MMKKHLFYFVTILCVFGTKAMAANIKGAVLLEGETFNFELSGQKNWDYDLKRIKDKNQSKVQLFVKSLDQQTIEKIKNIDNPFVKAITVTQNAIDNKWLVEFTLKNEQVETFDYLTDQPSKLIIDFYKSENTASTNEEKQPVVALITKKAITTKAVKKTEISRTPADADVLILNPAENSNDDSFLSKAGLYDAGDGAFTRFSMKESDYKDESVIKSRSNYYLKFPVLESEFSFWKKMKANPPLYDVKPDNNDENKQARLLKTLFEKKRFLVFIQTSEWFKKKYPDSKYSDMLSFMTGDAFIELWRAEKIESLYEQAQNAYREALGKYPESILAERTSLMVGMLAVDKLDYMAAIRKLEIHVANKKYSNKASQQYAKIGLAYSYSKINKLDDGLKHLSEIEKQTQDPIILAEAAVRRGDFYFFTKKNNEAIVAYDLAAKKFPVVAKMFPSAYFNKMEAQFWQEKLQDSHKSGLEFAQHFPAHEFAPYALTRVGELLDIMGADQSKSVGAYLETHFRYGDSPKTIVARLHLLSTKMKSMKPEELEQTLVKMDDLALKSELANVDQFKVAMISDGFSRRKDYLRAIDILSKFFQQNPTRPDAKQVTQRIVKNINDQLKNLSDLNQYKDLLKTYRQYSDTWLKTHSRIDTDYFLGLAYENAGAFDYAIEKFKKVSAALALIKGTAAEKIANVNQYLPTNDTLNLKLSKNNYDNNAFQEAYQNLEKIQNPLDLTDEEQILRVQLASQLYEKKGDAATSIRYLSDLSNLWKGDAEMSLPVQFKLADVQIQKNNISDAILTFEKCREIIIKSEKPTESDVIKYANNYSQLLINQNKNDEAILVLSEVIKKFESKFKLNQERYLLGNLQFNNGDIKKAETTWAPLNENVGGIWQQLASEKLKQAAWDVGHKNHIKRIPAMSQFEGQKND